MSAAVDNGQVNALDAVRALREALRLVTADYQLTPVTITRDPEGKKRARFHENWRRDSAWSRDPDQIRDWSVQHACSFAIRTGTVGGCDVVDLDGDDGILWWSERGYPLGSMIVDTISGGLHSFVAPSGLPTAAKRFGPSVDTRGDGGLVFAPGSFIRGEEGTYSVRGPLVAMKDLAPLPADLAEAIRTSQPETKDHPADGRATEHDREWMLDKTRAAVERVASMPRYTDGDEFREAQMGAAMMLGRIADVGLCTLDVARELIEEATLKVWPDGLSEADEKNIASGLIDGPRKERWQVRHPLSSASDGSAAEPDAYEKAVANKLRELQVADEARRRLAQQRRAHRPRIAEGVIDDLDSIPEPVMLMGSLVPDQAVGFLAGRSGAYKSFLATAWACCIATGRPWLGRAEFAVTRPMKVLYVAAEGAAGAAGRIRAWEADAGVSRRGRLMLYPRPIHLNDSAQVEELTAYVLEHGFQFLVIDTYHRSAPGTEENSSTEFGVVFEAVATLRDEHGLSTLFVDHTGGQKNGNPRGTSAKRDDADYVLSTTYAGEEAVAGAQREMFVSKLKDSDTTGRWCIRLVPVEGQTFPVAKIGMVDGPDAFATLTDWWLPEHCPPMSDELLEKIDKAANEQRGRGRDSARWIWRLMAAIDDELGLTQGEIKRMFRDAPPAQKFSEEIIKRGVTVLKKAGICWQDGARIGLEERS